MHGRQQVLVNLGQVWTGANLALGINRRGAAGGEREERKRRGHGEAQRIHCDSPRRTPTPWRYTMVHPFQPVTARMSTTMAESTSPVGTTEV